MSKTMEHTKHNKIDGIFKNTMAILENARTTLKVKEELLEFVDADPTNIRIEILDYAAAIDMLDELIVDDVIVDEDAFSIIYRMVEKYKIYVEEDYPATGALLAYHLKELDSHYLNRFDN
jgi:hypothetical protein